MTPSRDFPGDAKAHKGFDRLAGSLKTQTTQLFELIDAGKRSPAQGQVALLPTRPRAAVAVEERVVFGDD